jgi:CubicO group peptidase (beta-lactamase class C family)
MKLRPGTPEEAGMSSERVARIKALAKRWVMEDKINPSLAILVARRGIVVLYEAFGQLTPEADSPPLAVDSLFPLVSAHKPMVGTLAMILVEDGELGLNRSVSYYIPEFRGLGKEKVQVHQLLTHTSGLSDQELNAWAEQIKDRLTLPPLPENQHPAIHENLNLRYDLPLSYKPGSEMRYANFGYELVGEIIRRISGQNYADFARERLFEPLGMKDTHYVVPEEIQPRIVIRPPDLLGAAWLNSRELQEVPWAGTGGAFSTVWDMAVFGQMFLNGGTYGDTRILSRTSVTEMTRNQIPGISAEYFDQTFPEAGWGLGWCLHLNKQSAAFAETLQSAQSFNHGGYGGTYFLVDPVHEMVICYFACEKDWENWWTAWPHSSRADLFINSVTAAIVDN